ncbi:MAG: hypothetical protein OEZ13_12180 [Spirochaetia bacterium]|nr:hypothetical protein [Spirochaetia bacterium]
MKLKLIKALFFLLFYCFTVVSKAISIGYSQEPASVVEPKEPSVGYEEKKKKRKDQNENEDKIQIQAKVTLGSRDEISGFIYLPQTIAFRHYKNGLIFEKKLFIKEIEYIEVLEYSQKKIKESPKESLFEFEPSRVKIKLKNKKEYYLDAIFNFFRNFSISTVDGTTNLYSYFADTYNAQTGWKEVESKNKNYHKKKPHPQAAVKIEIIDLPSAAGDSYK